MSSFDDIAMTDSDRAEYSKRYQQLRATDYIPYKLKHHESLPSGYPDHSLKSFTDKRYETSLILKCPAAQYGERDRTILLTLPPHQRRGSLRSPKPFQDPSATLTIPASVPYENIVAMLDGGATITEIPGVQVETADSPGSTSIWNLEVLTSAYEIQQAEDTIRASLDSGASNAFDRDHLVPIDWHHGTPTKALHMTRAPPAERQWITTPGGGYYGYP